MSPFTTRPIDDLNLAAVLCHRGNPGLPLLLRETFLPWGSSTFQVVAVDAFGDFVIDEADAFSPCDPALALLHPKFLVKRREREN